MFGARPAWEIGQRSNVALSSLAKRFRRQEEFATGYSPLYASLFGSIADWLDQPERDPIASWLIGASRGRKPFDVPLLLLAGLHRDVLSGHPDVTLLAQYFPTVGGALPYATDQFRNALRAAIMARQDQLGAFLQTALVQTNETGRGIAWLLPLQFATWTGVHLVDLGASAGLNLVADARSFRIIDEDSGARLLDLGGGESVQFRVQCQGEANRMLDLAGPTPHIASRTGCDLAPFELATSDDELTLSAFVWGDQPSRLQRLQEGIQALHRINHGEVPVNLYAVDLPDQLPQFLDLQVPDQPQLPLVIYNTYLTIYLKHRGDDIRRHIRAWAVTQTRPILWLQWEPSWGECSPPENGWCAWTADLWQGATHYQWRLAWVHPHGARVRWETGMQDWIGFWRRS